MWTLHQGVPVAVATSRARPANTPEILAHTVLGDRVSDSTLLRFRAPGQQQGFLDVTGRRRGREEGDDVSDGAEEPPATRARPSPGGAASSSTAPAAVRTTSGGEEQVSNQEAQQPEDEPMATPLEQAWARRNPGAPADPGTRLAEHLRGRPGTAAQDAAAAPAQERLRSRSAGRTSAGGPSAGELAPGVANLAALLAEADGTTAGDSSPAEAAARGYLDWQVWWLERVEETSIERWANQRSARRPAHKSLKLQKRGKLLKHAKEPPHIQEGLDKSRAAEWAKWQKHSAADIVSAADAARMVSEGAEEIDTH